MFRCHACTRRTLKTLFAHAFDQPHQSNLLTGLPFPQAPSYQARFGSVHPAKSWSPSRRGRRGRLQQQQQQQRRRGYATAAAATTSSNAVDDVPYPGAPIPFTKQPPQIPKWGSQISQAKVAAATTKIPEPSIYKPKDLERELRWLRDPLKLADRTVTLIREDTYFKALALVRLASRDLLCTVSWNHLMDWNMTKGNVTVAIKIYNEVRASIPLSIRSIREDLYALYAFGC